MNKIDAAQRARFNPRSTTGWAVFFLDHPAGDSHKDVGSKDYPFVAYLLYTCRREACAAMRRHAAQHLAHSERSFREGTWQRYFGGKMKRPTKASVRRLYRVARVSLVPTPERMPSPAS